MVTHLIRERGEQIGNEKETERVSYFGIAFDEDSGFDESSAYLVVMYGLVIVNVDIAIANRTADFLGVKFYKKHMNEAELAQRFEDATWHCEHHNPDLNYVGKYALSEVPLELGYKVVLTGEGADETFAGYPIYLADYLREPNLSWPHQKLTDIESIAKCEQNDEEIIKYYESIGADALAHNSPVPQRMLNNITTSASMTAFSPALLFASWTSCYGACDPRLTIANNISVQTLSKIEHSWHPLNSAMYVWTKGHSAAWATNRDGTQHRGQDAVSGSQAHRVCLWILA
jgi:asparagine synthase (glutamine-hydrolysing)